MGTISQCERYDWLREREFAGTLTEAERAELTDMLQALDDREAAYLAAANEREDLEIAANEAAIARLEEQNRLLRDYLRERHAFLARARALVTELQAEDQRMRRRFTSVLELLHEPSASMRD